MFIIRHKKIFIALSTALVAASIAVMLVFGFNVGIDFKGGSSLEVVYSVSRPEQSALADRLSGLGLGSVSVQPTGDLGYVITLRHLTENEKELLLEALAEGEEVAPEELGFNSVGPSVGRQLARKAIISVVLVSLAIVLFIAYALRKVSAPVSSWKYGLIAIVALLHDVIIASGVFSLLSNFNGAELDTLFVVSILTILGLSVFDTIVIFDRIRENMRINEEEKLNKPFPAIVGASLEQSFMRSFSTTFTLILALLSLFIFGPDTTENFALILAVGMAVGVYSSLFLASSLLVLTEEKQRAKLGKKL